MKTRNETTAPALPWTPDFVRWPVVGKIVAARYKGLD